MIRAGAAGALLGALLGCTDTTEATVAPILAPCVLPYAGESMCLQITDDGGAPRRVARDGMLYLRHAWGETVAIAYAEPRGDESVNCFPVANECHRVVDQEVTARMAVGTRFSISFADDGAGRAWLAASGQGVRMGTDVLEAEPAVAAQALELDAMPVAYQLDLVLTGSSTAPLRLVAATAR